MNVVNPFKDQLSTENEEVEYHSFSTALEALKEGNRVTRKNWNGPNQWIEIQEESEEMDRSYLYIKTVSGDTVPWVASQSDLLSDDWIVL